MKFFITATRSGGELQNDSQGQCERRGQNLATHLLNAHDNERVEIAHTHGSIAGDTTTRSEAQRASWSEIIRGATNCALKIPKGPAKLLI
jgi:hypothetical protein